MSNNKSKKSYAYIIRSVSNIHVGSGDTNYGVIDNLVQRDPINDYPCINPSSLKGALREYFKYNGSTYISHIFGNEKAESEDAEKKLLNAGAFHFDMGYLLTIPVRSDKVPFIHCTSKKILEQFAEHLELYGDNSKLQGELTTFINELNDKDEAVVFDGDLVGAFLEEHDCKTTKSNAASWGNVAQLLNSRNLAIVSDEKFKEIISSLPVIARNNLENGESKNLWYEEIVPRESRFYTIVQHDSRSSKVDAATLTTHFNGMVTKNLVQIGANASVGYGKTKISIV